MRTSSRVAFVGLAFGLLAALAAPAADDPNGLLKPVAPSGAGARVRVVVTGGCPETTQIKAQVPHGKKKSDLIDVSVALDTQPGKSYVSAKMLESWGYEVPKSKEFVLPELLISGAQAAPVPKKGGRDVTIRLTNVKLAVVEAPAGTQDKVYTCSLSLSATELFKGGERAIEPRFAFADKFLEMTVPGAALKRAETSDAPLPGVTADPAPGRIPAAGPTVMRNGLPVFAYASVNGMTEYKLGNGTPVPVNVGVASINNWNTGVVVTIGLARGCKVKMEQGKDAGTGTGVESKTEMIPGTIEELRLGLVTGPGLKAQKDLVLKDLPVVIDKNASEGYLWLGPKFIETYFKDGVYASGPDGVWKLHGRCDPELLFDTKTRKKP